MKNNRTLPIFRFTAAWILIGFVLGEVGSLSFAEAVRSSKIGLGDVNMLKKKIDTIEKSQKEIVQLDQQIRSSVKQVTVFAHHGPRRKKKKKK